MRHRYARWRWIAVLALLGYLFLRVGRFIAPSAVPDFAITNAFLFLMGLGGALALLSPISRPLRYRMR